MRRTLTVLLSILVASVAGHATLVRSSTSPRANGTATLVDFYLTLGATSRFALDSNGGLFRKGGTYSTWTYIGQAPSGTAISIQYNGAERLWVAMQTGDVYSAAVDAQPLSWELDGNIFDSPVPTIPSSWSDAKKSYR